MEILAVNGSPRGSRGTTHLVLSRLLEGARAEGARCRLVELNDLDIRPCLGELACWFKTPGRCIIADAMEELLPAVARADALVLATPVFADGPSALTKLFADRLIPLLEPFFELRDGHFRHPKRQGVNVAKTALVSTCGYWELDNFDVVVEWAKRLTAQFDAVFAGALLRPHAPILERFEEAGKEPPRVYQAAFEAGRQLVNRETIDEDVLAGVSRPLLPAKFYLMGANRFFETELEKLEKRTSGD